MGSQAALLVGGRRLPPRPPTPPYITKNYLEAELYCFLCRTELPWSKSPDLFPLSCSHEHAEWETDVICRMSRAMRAGSRLPMAWIDPPGNTHEYLTNMLRESL
jgi:hypothetical protein